jgi:PAS domain S-box-containing protein
MMLPDKEYFQKTKELLAIIDLDGRFLEVSNAWEKVLGWTADELKSKTYMELLHPEDIEKSITAATNLVEDGKRNPYFENRYLHKNGGYIWFQWDGYVFSDKKMYAVARDITILKEKEFFFDEVQKIAKIGCWKVNIDTKETLVSDEIFRIHEVPYGTPFSIEKGLTFFPAEFREFISEKARNLAEKKEEYDLEVPFVTALGNVRMVRVIGRFSDKGGLREVYGLFQDITEQVTKQNELDIQRTKSIHASKMASLGEMAANIAHEINNPLSLIQGRAEHLISKLNSTTISQEEILAGLDQIQRTSERIAKIIKGLRVFSRTDDQIAFVKVPLKTIIEDFLGLCAEKLKNEGFDLRVSKIPSAEINCISAQLSQVFLNLINNSVESLQNQKEKWIKIDFIEKKNCLLIKISDSGKPIEKALVEKIMQPFFSTKANGSGLGLSISNGIISNHNGKLYYDETELHTTFCIELPYLHT